MNLAETQVTVRRFILGVAVVTLFYYTGKFIVLQGIGIYQRFNPPPPPAPEAKFGKLAQLKMTKITVEGSPEYLLDTQDGKLPAFPDRLKVYPIKEPVSTLLSEQRIKQLAQDLGFTGSYTPLSKSEFRWVDGVNGRTFTAQVITKNFSLQTQSANLSVAISSAPAIKNADAEPMVSQFLKSKNLMSATDLSNLYFKSTPTQLSLGEFRETGITGGSAKISKVDVYRVIQSQTADAKPINYPILGPNPNDSKISFYTTNAGGNYKFPIINFTYWEANYDDGSDYYLSPIADVWTAIKSGQGIVVYAKPDDVDYYNQSNTINLEKIEIRDIYLAYYEPKDLASHLQPIYVFAGRLSTQPESGGISQSGEVTIYYPAVRGDWVN